MRLGYVPSTVSTKPMTRPVSATRALIPKRARCHVIVDGVAGEAVVLVMGREATP